MSRIYPTNDLTSENMNSELFEKTYTVPAMTTCNKTSSLEKNCSQIFMKGPALTRDILEKMQKAEIVPNSTFIFGYEVKTKQFWVFSGLILLYLLSLTGTMIMWCTSAFDNAIFANLVLTNNSNALEMWEHPAPKPLLKWYIFNYTNVQEYENGEAKKLNVKELGPYVYEESLERVNVKFIGESSVSYQEQRSYKFMPELSNGRKQNDRVIVPNVPVFTAASTNKHSNFLTRLALSGLLRSIQAKPFINLAAHRFIVGYDDNLYTLGKSMLKFQNQKPYENFGLVAGKIGKQSDITTINNGQTDINQIALIQKFNGKDELDFWSTDECNNFKQATDGTLFPPKTIREKRPVQFYFKEMCRPLPLEFEKEIKILNNKIPAYRYKMPVEVFDAPEKKPGNQCYCNMDSGECPLQGVFNTSTCNFGAPAFMSFPHFYNADQRLKDGVTGLNPKPTLHETHVDVHPTMGFVMAGKTRLQFNVQVVKSYGISQMDDFEDGLMLPVAWFELSLEDKTLPDDIVSIIFQTTFTVKSVELSLKYGCLLTNLVTLVALTIILKNRWPRHKRTGSVRPLQRPSEDNSEV